MSIILFLVILLLLVLVHEFGHFIVAKKSGIRVDEFAFGFPPRLFSVKKGETTYAFNALPFGGYVKIHGENPSDVADGGDESRSFTAKPRIIQSAVIVAGVISNLLLAWLVLSLMLMIGATASSEDTKYTLSDVRVMVVGAQEGSSAERAGIIPGDVVLSLAEGEEAISTPSMQSIAEFISVREGKSIALTYKRQQEEKTVEVIPESGIIPDAPAIGISMQEVGTLKLPLHRALIEGARYTWEYTKLTTVGITSFLWATITGHSDFSQVSGPVGIVKAVGQAAELGFANLLLFTALISINLAMINILPFPALDGGRLLFIVIESIIRRPIPLKVQNIFNVVGFALLMLLMVVVTFHDIAKSL